MMSNRSLLLCLSLYCAAAREGIPTVVKVDSYASLDEKTVPRKKTQVALQQDSQRNYDRYGGASSSYPSAFLTDSGGLANDPARVEELQTGGSSGVVPPTTGQLLRVRGNATLWLIPILGCFFSYASFGQVSRLFLRIVQWASSNTWIPTSRDDIDLQTNVVTQVVNGPVITSISVLFATLVSLTVSKLHSRQVEVHRSLVLEVHYLRELMTLLNSKTVSNILHGSRLVDARKIVADHVDMLYSAQYATGIERQNTHQYIESTLPELVACTIEYDGLSMTSNHWDEFVRRINADIRRLAQRLMEQRSNRWMALRTPFPLVHYLTLALLAVSIMISFLVATAQSEFIFLKGSPVRVLWSLLTTSFLALGLVCFDLGQPFGGAYHIP